MHNYGDAMKASTKANETRPDQTAVKILAGAGQLRAMMWKPEERWQVAIIREDADTGNLSDVLDPEDIISLAELATLIAQALHDHADLGDAELSDDLGCLAHNLARTLGIKPVDSANSPKRTLQ